MATTPHPHRERSIMNEQQERGCRECGPGCLGHDMTAEQQGSDESGEGLSEALRKAARDHIGLSEGEFWPSSIADAQAVAVERILADRLAAVQAERDEARSMHDHSTQSARDFWQRAESAEAALATARRDADELRDRLAAVEALADDDEAWAWTAPVGPGNASYANGYENGRRSLADDLRAALANPSAAQGEGEVGAE